MRLHSTVFLMPYQIVTGGVTGLSAIIFYATQFKLRKHLYDYQCSIIGCCTEDIGFKVYDENHLRYYCVIFYAKVCTTINANRYKRTLRKDIRRRPKVYVAHLWGVALQVLEWLWYF